MRKNKPVYLDYAAASPLLNSVSNLIFMEAGDFYNPSSDSELARHNRWAIENVRKLIANEINCSVEEIIFTSGASEANGMIINAVKHDAPACLYASAIEHSSILNYEPHISIPVDEYGYVSVKTLDELLVPGNYVAIQHANNEIGTIQDIKALSHVAHKHDCWFHMDAAQTFGKIKIDVQELGIDSMSVSAGKLGALRGTGFLYCRKGLQDKLIPLVYGTQENGLRGGTEFDLGIKCLGAAVNEIDYRCSTVVGLKRDYFLDMMMDLPNVELIGPIVNRLSNNIFLSFKNLDISSQQFLASLEQFGYIVSAGSACHAGDSKVSHVLKAIGLPEELTKTCIRITIGPDTDVNDLRDLAELIEKLIDMHSTASYE